MGKREKFLFSVVISVCIVIVLSVVGVVDSYISSIKIWEEKQSEIFDSNGELKLNDLPKNIEKDIEEIIELENEHVKNWENENKKEFALIEIWKALSIDYGVELDTSYVNYVMLISIWFMLFELSVMVYFIISVKFTSKKQFIISSIKLILTLFLLLTVREGINLIEYEKEYYSTPLKDYFEFILETTAIMSIVTIIINVIYNFIVARISKHKNKKEIKK